MFSRAGFGPDEAEAVEAYMRLTLQVAGLRHGGGS